MEGVISPRTERTVLELEVLGVKKRGIRAFVQVNDRLLWYAVAFGRGGEVASRGPS